MGIHMDPYSGRDKAACRVKKFTARGSAFDTDVTDRVSPRYVLLARPKSYPSGWIF
jgi:hypothetical protein